MTKAPLPGDLRDTFELSLKLPETPGKTLAFPAVQTCEQGETAWVQLPADGQSADDLEHPAPSFVVTEAEEDSGDEQVVSNAELAAVTDTAAGSGDDGSGSALTWVALGLGALGFVFGGLALFRPGLFRPRASTPAPAGSGEDAS